MLPTVFKEEQFKNKLDGIFMLSDVLFENSTFDSLEHPENADAMNVDGRETTSSYKVDLELGNKEPKLKPVAATMLFGKVAFSS